MCILLRKGRIIDASSQRCKITQRLYSMVKICNINKVVKDSTDSGFQQGVSHMGRDICSHVKSKCKHGSSLNDSRADKFVHKNHFRPLFAYDIESNIESKCQNEDSTCASKERQACVLPVVLSVKDVKQKCQR